MQKQHGVGASDPLPGALDADLFHRVLAFAQACGVDHMQGHTLDLDGLAHHVPGGASDRRDDGQFRTRECVEQRTLAGIGLACDHHGDALAQESALACAGKHLGQTRLQTIELALGVGLPEEVDLLLREVERCLDQHAQMDQGIAQGVHLARELARERSAGAARSGFGAGVDQVGDGLGLGQVNLVVEECPLGELAGIGHAQAGEAGLSAGGIDLGSGLQAAGQQQLQHHRSPVGLQLQHVLAREGVRGREKQGQAVVDGAAVRRHKRAITRLPRLQLAAAQGAYQRAQAAA